jgi:cation-dependent mannose-6-phosphate receptor
MHFSALPNTLLFSLALYSGVNATSEEKKEKVVEPCTIVSPKGHFYDLRSLTATLPVEGKKATKYQKTEDWPAQGYDYHNGTDFKLNICAPVIGEVEDVVGVDKGLWRNVSAYYELDSKNYSIG